MQRTKTGWTIQRIILLTIGLFIFVAAVASQQWLGAAIGGFVAAMGLFGYQRGATGSCVGKACCTPYGDDACSNMPLYEEVDEEPEMLQSTARAIHQH